MCLAVPGKIVSVNETDPLFRLGVVDFGGVTREVNLACVPEAVPGDYVIVHVGMALSVLDEETALQTRREMREIVENTSWAAEASGEKMPGDAYEWVMHEEEGLLELDWRPLMKSVDEDLLEGVSRGCIARKFHESLVNLVFDVAERFCLDRLVLGGGCFQNAFLLEGLAGMAQSRRCQLALPQRVPCNDGGISLGQVAAVVRQWKG